MADSETDSHKSKRRKVAGPIDSIASSAPADQDDEPQRKNAVTATHVTRSQDPRLLHYLDGHRIVRRSHTPFASGGFCDVFIGDHQVYGKVAMRRPRMTEAGYTFGEMENFFNESEIWKKLRHQNILQFIGLIQSDGNIWAVSRFADNGTLTTYLKNHPRTDRRALVLQLADAIAYLHRQSVVHGDIKGSNILVSAEGAVLLCDFGLSKPSDTLTNTLLSGAASIRWCAPELLFDEATKTYASDVYSFGMTVYEILSGNVPFYTITNDLHLINTIKNDRGRRPPREPPTSESGDSYEELWNIASESWDGNPSSRPSMGVLCGRLGVPVNFTLGTAVEEFSILGSMAPHSLASTSSPTVANAERGFDHGQSGAHLTGNNDRHNIIVQQSNIREERMVMNPSIEKSSTIESRTDEEYRKKQENETLIRGIPRSDARYDDTSTKPSRPCHPGTRITLLQLIRDWINDESSTSLFFWLCGEVGVGKTTVAHTIAKEQDELRQMGASFFFNRDDDKRRYSLLFASTIAYQLARFDPKAYQAVAKALQPDPDLVRRDLKKQFIELVVKPLVCLNGSPSRKVVIVIDGLDECNDPVAILAILPLLTQVAGLRLRVLVTSRPNAAIVTKFEAARLYHLTAKTQFRNVNPQALNNDVRVYLEWSLAEIASEYSLPSPWPSPKQFNMLVERTDGLFVIASVFDRYICDPTEGNPSEQLERILSRRKVVGGSPTADLDSMYDLVLEDLKRSLPEKDIGFARYVLQLAFLSSQTGASPWGSSGLSMSDIADVLDTTPSNVLSVLRRMTSVLRLANNDGGYIAPFHASFREYIHDSERCSVVEFVMEPASSHAELAAKYLEIFSRAADGGITGIEYDFDNRPPSKLKIAARELRHHLSSVADPVPIQLRQAKDKFCRGAFQIWLFVCYWSSRGKDDKLLCSYIKEAGLETACAIRDEASLQRSMVRHIVDHIQQLSVGCSYQTDGGDGYTDDTTFIVDEADLQTFRVKLQWENKFGISDKHDPRYFARMLWRWTKLEHPNIVPLRRIGLETFAEPREGAIISVPSTSQYRNLKRDWYPSVLHAFKQNSKGAVETILDLARALQYLQEIRGSGLHICIEDIVLTQRGKAMLHPLFLAYGHSVDPSFMDEERRSLVKRGFAYWPSYAGVVTPVWDFGSVIYEMMTGEPPLKRYHDLAMGSKSNDGEPDETPLSEYCDHIKRTETSKHERFSPSTEFDWWLVCDGTREDTLQRRYRTAVHHLLNNLRVSEDLKGVVRASWAVDAEAQTTMQDIVVRLTTILKGL